VCRGSYESLEHTGVGNVVVACGARFRDGHLGWALMGTFTNLGPGLLGLPIPIPNYLKYGNME
jgi:hypothetical protein